LFATLPEPWSVPGLAAGHSAGLAVGFALLAALLGRKVPEARRDLLPASVARSVVVACVAGAGMLGLRLFLPDASRAEVALSLAAVAACGGALYAAVMKALGARELVRLVRVFGLR
jgi:hypothetical protein